jgi:hypothetical protein
MTRRENRLHLAKVTFKILDTEVGVPIIQLQNPSPGQSR